MRVSASSDPRALLAFDFLDATLPWHTGCAWLAGATRESWRIPGDPVTAETAAADGGGALLERRAGPWAVRALHVAAGADAALTAREAYARLLAATRGSPHPYLIRIWNFLGAINAGAGDAERYRRFCIGRNDAVDALFRDPPPAATAIGADDPDAPLALVALCSAKPAIALENPRQTPAWQYPREYGPVPPGFSRGAVLRDDDGALLLASGTASIVGHVSQHRGDVIAQLDESLVNLQVLLDEGGRRSGERFTLDGLQALRVYLRCRSDLAAVQARLDALALPLERIAFLRGDICRAELDVEIEGAFGAASTPPA